jgi:phosphatidylserine/phosphatidylglycerophosphate/cardiolipin synthase-like enzyme
MHAEKRRKHNEEFLRRFIARHPEEKERCERRLRRTEVLAEGALEGRPAGPPPSRDQVLETIVDEERPVLFVNGDRLDRDDVAIRGSEARALVDRLVAAEDRLRPLLPLVGRIDVVDFPFPVEFVGTGWFVAEDVVVTNRHVASLIARWDGRRFAFSRGIGGRLVGSSLCTTHEKEDAALDQRRVFAIEEVLYIERETDPHDIAFVRVKRRADGNGPVFLPVAAGDAGPETAVVVIGYPARASKKVIPNQALMEELYRGRFDVKRAAPGFTMETLDGTARHDCTTLGGNSGSVVLDLNTFQAVGLHFAGLYQETNYGVRASVLNEYISRRRWNEPFVIESPPTPPPAPGAPGPVTSAVPVATTGEGTVTVTIPLVISVKLGTPVLGPAAAPTARPPVDAQRAEEAVRAFWPVRPPEVLAARVGYFDDGLTIGDEPCIAASVRPSRLAQVAATAPREFQGVPIRYLPAEVGEQVDALPVPESVDSILYDDDAREGEDFSLEPVDEEMDLLLHVGPEYSWDTLKEFLRGANGLLVSAMYEFHAKRIQKALEERLEAGGSLTLVLDNASFHAVSDEDEDFDRPAVFGGWADEYGSRFKRIVAPEGLAGLISDSYHIKVTVRDDHTFWLSSGNWKAGSSQPEITQDQRDAASEEDLPGNREWHVVVKNRTLASRFRRHILQDFARSEALGGGPVPGGRHDETVVEEPLEESILLERRPPSRLLEPKPINGRRKKVRPLLTPDQEGAVFAEAVLELIESARESLLFQIPYIAMPSNPNADRGYIDKLIKALTRKLKTLDDARVLLRSGGSKYSSPTHAAWYFKSKGVNIAERLRSIENHHTKGMIVDGRRVLVGSHNWSKPGVTLNRDASLLFDDAEVAGYYAQAFEIDWERSNPIRPKKYVKEAGLAEAPGGVAGAAFRRVPLADFRHDA